MCRRNQIWGVALAAFGLGLLVASFIESVLFCGCAGIGCVAVAVVILQKK